MLVFDWKRTPNDPAFDAMLVRLKALVADMEAVQAGIVAGGLSEDAPLLDRWSLAQRPSTCLIGRSSGHPLLPGEDRAIATSDLWLISADGRWARTLSRWYRLGEPGRSEGNDTWWQ
jgi:hypothetical protein